MLLNFQVGADTTSENKTSVTMDSMSAKSIGVDGIQVTGSDSTNADKAVDTISDAIYYCNIMILRYYFNRIYSKNEFKHGFL